MPDLKVKYDHKIRCVECGRIFVCTQKCFKYGLKEEKLKDGCHCDPCLKTCHECKTEYFVLNRKGNFIGGKQLCQ